MADSCWRCNGPHLGDDIYHHADDCPDKPFGIIYGHREISLEEVLDTPEKREQFQADLTESIQREIEEDIARQTWWERRWMWILFQWHHRVRDPLHRLWHRWRCSRGSHDPTEAYGPTDCWWCDEPLVLGRVQLEDEDAEREDQAFEKELMERMAEAVCADIDLVMVTPCVICGVIGYGHLEGPPPECTGFVMPEDPDAEPADS